jgi:hypothetical protein
MTADCPRPKLTHRSENHAPSATPTVGSLDQMGSKLGYSGRHMAW